MATQVVTHATGGLASPGLARPTSRGERNVALGRLGHAAAVKGLLVAMALGSVALWTIVPAAVLWILSRLSGSSGQLTFGILLALGVAIPAAIALGAAGLTRVERVYMRMTGAAPRSPVVSGWRRSLRDSDALGPATVLEKQMVASVLLAVLALGTWFFAFAGSSLPA
jgi:hypothetical protein